jgi:large subunit ribosomal protein L15
MNLNEVHRGVAKNRRRTRVGRGPGSGHGKTSGRGHKGQGQLAGWRSHPAFEGGQMPLARRIPKRGFNNQWARDVRSLNVGELEALFADGETVSVDSLRAVGRIRGAVEILKILGTGELTKKLTVQAHRFSEAAKAKIEAVGGTVEVVVAFVPVAEKQAAARAARKAAKAAAKSGGGKTKKK